jgi:hypothetical protein
VDPDSTRLHDFAREFPSRNAYTTIHSDDLSDGLGSWFDWGWGERIGNPCLEAELVDVAPDTEGLQYECTASLVVNPGENHEETLLRYCDPASTFAYPCWHLVEDRQACPETPTGLTLVVERLGGVPLGTHIQARCRTE